MFKKSKIFGYVLPASVADADVYVQQKYKKIDLRTQAIWWKNKYEQNTYFYFGSEEMWVC